MSLNQVSLIGNLGADPDIRATNSGSKIANIRLATSETWKDKSGDKQERTEWHTVVVFGDGLVRVVENYVKKGDTIFVQGQLRTRKWTDQNGNERYATEVVLSGPGANLRLLGGKGSGSGGTSNQRNSAASFKNDDLDDDIPW